MHSWAEGCCGWGTSNLPSVPVSEGSACRELSPKGVSQGAGSVAWIRGQQGTPLWTSVWQFLVMLKCSHRLRPRLQDLEVGICSSFRCHCSTQRRSRIPYHPWAACLRGSVSSGQGWCWRTDPGSHRHDTEQGRGWGREGGSHCLAPKGQRACGASPGPVGEVTQRPAHEDSPRQHPDSALVEAPGTPPQRTNRPSSLTFYMAGEGVFSSQRTCRGPGVWIWGSVRSEGQGTESLGLMGRMWEGADGRRMGFCQQRAH